LQRHDDADRERLRLITVAMRNLAEKEAPNFFLLARLDEIARSLRRQIRR
jgi:hypothetical protein